MAETGLIVGLAVGIPVGILLIFGGLFLLRKYLRGPTTGSKTNTRLDGKVVVITGANTGIGKETAREIYKRGANILILCRSKERAEGAIRDIIEKSKGKGGPVGTLDFVSLDLGSLKSVRTCAEEVKGKVDHIDILINNAGLFRKDTGAKTEDGFNMTFGVNHMGPVLLTELLLPLVFKGAERDSKFKPKVITVASVGHIMYPLDFDKLEFDVDSDTEAWRAYCVSKLANVLHSKELHHRYHPQINTYSLHPGAVATEVFRDVPGYMQFLVAIAKPFFKTPYHGAQTTLYCALHPKAENESGLYYENCAVKKPHQRAEIRKDQKRLWEYSRKAVGLENE